MPDVLVPTVHWTNLRKKKLFFVPEIHAGFAASLFTKLELVKVSDGWGSNAKVSPVVSADVCDLKPVTYDKAVCAMNAYNAVRSSRANKQGKDPFGKQLSDADIVFAAFRVLAFDDLFSGEAIGKLGISADQIQKASGLSIRTVENFLGKGRMTATSVLKILEAFNSLFSKLDSAILPKGAVQEAMKKFLLDGQSAYVTSSPSVPYCAIATDRHGVFLRELNDLSPAPNSIKIWHN